MNHNIPLILSFTLALVIPKQSFSQGNQSNVSFGLGIGSGIGKYQQVGSDAFSPYGKTQFVWIIATNLDYRFGKSKWKTRYQIDFSQRPAPGDISNYFYCSNSLYILNQKSPNGLTWGTGIQASYILVKVPEDAWNYNPEVEETYEISIPLVIEKPFILSETARFFLSLKWDVGLTNIYEVCITRPNPNSNTSYCFKHLSRSIFLGLGLRKVIRS